MLDSLPTSDSVWHIFGKLTDYLYMNSWRQEGIKNYFLTLIRTLFTINFPEALFF